MNHSAALLSLVLVLYLPLSLKGQSQLNLKAGYNISFLGDPEINQVISDFNHSQSYTSSFKSLQWMHGLEAGIRLKAHVHAFELTYQNAYRHLRAQGTSSADNQPYEDKINISIHSAALGYQLSGETIGIGTDLQYQWYRTKVELVQATDPFIDIQGMMALKYYLMITLSGNQGIDMAIQPYIVMPLDYYDSAPLSRYLNQGDGVGSEKWARFGLTLVFYNGVKRF